MDDSRPVENFFVKRFEMHRTLSEVGFHTTIDSLTPDAAEAFMIIARKFTKAQNKSTK
jgi:hypothetical protein